MGRAGVPAIWPAGLFASWSGLGCNCGRERTPKSIRGDRRLTEFTSRDVDSWWGGSSRSDRPPAVCARRVVGCRVSNQDVHETLRSDADACRRHAKLALQGDGESPCHRILGRSRWSSQRLWPSAAGAAWGAGRLHGLVGPSRCLGFRDDPGHSGHELELHHRVPKEGIADKSKPRSEAKLEPCHQLLQCSGPGSRANLLPRICSFEYGPDQVEPSARDVQTGGLAAVVSKLRRLAQVDSQAASDCPELVWKRPINRSHEVAAVRARAVNADRKRGVAAHRRGPIALDLPPPRVKDHRRPAQRLCR